MKPASLSALAGTLVLALPIAPVAEAETLAERVSACGGIAEAGPRLACFDRLAAETTKADVSTPEPAGPGAGNAVFAAAATPAVAASSAAAPAISTPAAAPPHAPVPPTAAPSAAAPTVAAPPLTAEQRFGREQALFAQSRSGDEAVREISATVTAVRSANDGRRTFELDNGQVWTHTETPIREFELRPGDRVTIRRGALSSFVLLVPGQPSTRVRRTR